MEGIVNFFPVIPSMQVLPNYFKKWNMLVEYFVGI